MPVGCVYKSPIREVVVVVDESCAVAPRRGLHGSRGGVPEGIRS